MPKLTSLSLAITIVAVVAALAISGKFAAQQYKGAFFKPSAKEGPVYWYCVKPGTKKVGPAETGYYIPGKKTLGEIGIPGKITYKFEPAKYYTLEKSAEQPKKEEPKATCTPSTIRGQVVPCVTPTTPTPGQPQPGEKKEEPKPTSEEVPSKPPSPGVETEPTFKQCPPGYVIDYPSVEKTCLNIKFNLDQGSTTEEKLIAQDPEFADILSTCKKLYQYMDDYWNFRISKDKCNKLSSQMPGWISSPMGFTAEAQKTGYSPSYLYQAGNYCSTFYGVNIYGI